MGLRQTFMRALARQAGHPRGWLGRLAIRGMNRSNAGMYTLVMRAMDIQPTDQVLDIGFGGGAFLVPMAEKASKGLVAGVDLSDTVVAAGRRRYSSMVTSGRIDIQQADVAALPYAAASFEKVCTVNSLYFWPNPDQAFREIFRVLKPGGLLAIGTRSAAWMRNASLDQYGFKIYDAPDISRMLTAAGFENVRVEKADHTLVTSGRRPAP